jgi:hypothetical protein
MFGKRTLITAGLCAGLLGGSASILAGSASASASLPSKSVSAAAAAAITEYCVANGQINDVRGSVAYLNNTECVDTNGASKKATWDVTASGHTGTLAGRYHVELSFNGKAIANTGETADPHYPFIQQTPWISYSSHGTYCVTVWNHDALGFFTAVDKACHNF